VYARIFDAPADVSHLQKDGYTDAQKYQLVKALLFLPGKKVATRFEKYS
jgi:hypothetical protein